MRLKVNRMRQKESHYKIRLTQDKLIVKAKEVISKREIEKQT